MSTSSDIVLQFVNLLGWVVAAASASAVLYGIYDTVKPDNPVELSKEVTALYNAVNRTVWGAAVCWVIFACATGNGGNYFWIRFRVTLFT